MNTLQEIFVFIIETLGSLFLYMVILRFFLQLARADFYNPMSQAIVKITNPLLIPLRKVIPGVFGIDLASIVLVLLFHFILAELIYFILAGSIYNPANILIWVILGTLNIITYMALIGLFIVAISSFIAPYSNNPLLSLIRQLIEPILRPVKNIIPAIGGLDFSVFFVVMGIIILQKLLVAAASSVQLVPSLIIGF